MENVRLPLFESFDSPDLDMCSSMNEIRYAHLSPETKKEGRN